MRRKIKPFNPAAKCPKCGHDKIITSYQEKLGRWRSSLDEDRPAGEHLIRVCQCCRFQWAEACVGDLTLAAGPEGEQDG